IVLNGQTISGGQVSVTLNVAVAAGFQTFTLTQSQGFSGLTSVSWVAKNTLVDNIVSIATPGASAANPTPALPAMNISSTAANPVIFNTTNGTVSGGTITGGSFAVTFTNNIATFVFNGDLNIAANSVLRAVGSRGLSIQITNNVTIGTGVTFDASAPATY